MFGADAAASRAAKWISDVYQARLHVIWFKASFADDCVLVDLARCVVVHLFVIDIIDRGLVTAR